MRNDAGITSVGSLKGVGMKRVKPAKHQVIRPMEAKSVPALPAGPYLGL